MIPMVNTRFQRRVFVSDGKVYKVSDPSKVQDDIGHKVTITGNVDSDTLKVESVKM
jgi:hypothetical protein